MIGRAERMATDRAAFGNGAVDASLARHHGMSLIERTIDEMVELEIRLGNLRDESARRHARTKLPAAHRDDPELLRQVSPYPMLADEGRDERKALEELRSYARGLLSKDWNTADTHLCELYADRVATATEATAT